MVEVVDGVDIARRRVVGELLGLLERMAFAQIVGFVGWAGVKYVGVGCDCGGRSSLDGFVIVIVVEVVVGVVVANGKLLYSRRWWEWLS